MGWGQKKTSRGIGNKNVWSMIEKKIDLLKRTAPHAFTLSLEFYK
jgi:hypothetical protein